MSVLHLACVPPAALRLAGEALRDWASSDPYGPLPQYAHVARALEPIVLVKVGRPRLSEFERRRRGAARSAAYRLKRAQR